MISVNSGQPRIGFKATQRAQVSFPTSSQGTITAVGVTGSGRLHSISAYHPGYTYTCYITVVVDGVTLISNAAMAALTTISRVVPNGSTLVLSTNLYAELDIYFTSSLQITISSSSSTAYGYVDVVYEA